MGAPPDRSSPPPAVGSAHSRLDEIQGYLISTTLREIRRDARPGFGGYVPCAVALAGRGNVYCGRWSLPHLTGRAVTVGWSPQREGVFSMPGPQPKNPATRRRGNKHSTHATLVREHNVEPPPLPEREEPWHELTVSWWYSVWASPMAPEIEKSDTHGLYLLAQLRDDFWSLPAEKARARSEIAAEIRLQEQRFGLSPYDRRRLQWTVEQVDEAQDKGRQRRARTVTQVDPGDDPRAALYSAS